MAVPFIDLRRFEPDFMSRWMEEVREVSENTMFVGGPKVAALEEKLAQRSGAPAVVGCANGTDALQLALKACGVGPGDVVLLPDATFWATFEAVVNVSAKPVTVDIDMADLQMDFDLFRKAVDEYKPKAAMLVHLYGWCSARLDDFRQLCAEKKIPLIEDGAQSFGVEWKGESIYKDAHCATVSFYPAKVFGSCGDAGAVYCSSKEMAEQIRLFGNHGRVTHYKHGVVGWNSRMAGMDAAWLNLSLDYIDKRLDSRRKAAAWWQEKLASVGASFVGPPEGCSENGYLCVTLQDPDNRPAVEAALKEEGIGFANTYPSSISTQPGCEGWIAGKVGGEKADLLARSVLNLPLFAYIREDELEEAFGAYQRAVKTAVKA